VLGIYLAYCKNDHSKSGHATAQHVILFLTSGIQDTDFIVSVIHMQNSLPTLG